jgi:hypothetical protein
MLSLWEQKLSNLQKKNNLKWDVVSRPRPLVAGGLFRRNGFDPSLVRIWSAVHKVVVGQIFSEIFRFIFYRYCSSVSDILTTSHKRIFERKSTSI